MVNLAKPRKVDETRGSLKSASKNSRKIVLITDFPEILTEFESVVCSEKHLFQSDNHTTSNAVRQLLSSLQALLNRKPGRDSCNTEQFERITNSLIKCLTELNYLLSSNSSFPESITLSALCNAFLLINYYNHFETKFATHQFPFSITSLVSCQVYFAFFEKSFKIDQSTLIKEFRINENSLTNVCDEIKAIIQKKNSSNCELTFRDVALLSGFLNCNSILEFFIKFMTENFIDIHTYVVKLCSLGLIHEFHVMRLLNQYLKILLDHKRSIHEYFNSTTRSYDEILLGLINKTLDQIDNNWESPVAGVGNSVKQAYRYIVELTKEPIENNVIEFKTFIITQFKIAMSLPFTSKSKYKKLSILMQTLSTANIDPQQLGIDTIPLDLNESKLSELPFLLEDNFASVLIQNLSINTLANAIAEFYKASITSIRLSYPEESKLTQVWSRLWLKAITQIFNDTLLSESTVVQNTLLAHIFPFTLQNVPNSMPILMSTFSNCSYGQVSLVRIYVEKNSILDSDLLPPRSWLLTMMNDADDMTRAECLALLIEEKFIARNRALVCKLVLHFVRTNLNIDNASFRQRIISKLEQFYSKIIISICDRHNASTAMTELSDTDQQVVRCVKDTLDTLALSLFPGSCFQRKFTALSVLGSLISIIDKEDKKGVMPNFFTFLIAGQGTNDWQELLLLGLVDKDDKIRRFTIEILMQYSKSSLALCCQVGNAANLNYDSLYSLSEKFLKSPRHQESHIGGLLLKYLLRSQVSKLSQFTHESKPGIQLITTLVQKTRDLFYSKNYQNDLLTASKREPLHGYILALNHCLTFASLNDVLNDNESNLNNLYNTLSDGQIKMAIFQPCIQLSLDCLEFFLKLLTPIDNSIGSEVELDDVEFDQNTTVSPSFFEMCQSIEQIIKQNSSSNFKNFEKDSQDVFLSNNFQLILSMCWLNIKENCFLLTTLTSLFADVLSLIQENSSSQTPQTCLHSLLMTGDELLQIGTKIVSVMMRCRHKGVIEASGVCLTKFTRTLLRIQCYLNTSKHLSQTVVNTFRQSLDAFVTQILTTIDICPNSTASSVTRRSAGLALIIQAILVGEAEAIHLDGLRSLSEHSESGTLYDRVISGLVSIATVPASLTSSELVDLPQSNALHVLRSIVGTSALSHLSAKTVEVLFPLCVTGFTSPLWQIRNSSLQLFGTCITRMLGQKKRIKQSSTDNSSHNSAELGTTITFDEFVSRYSSLIAVIIAQFEQCVQCPNQLHPELVPVLALLASFTPVGEVECEPNQNKSQIVHFLVGFLSNPIWKVRMLAAQAMFSLWSFSNLEAFIGEWCRKSSNQLSCNQLHGLMCVVEHWFELKAMVNSTQTMSHLRVQYFTMFSPLIQHKNCDILTKLSLYIFHTTDNRKPIGQSTEENVTEPEANDYCQRPFQTTNESFVSTLLRIRNNVAFKKSSDIRHSAALEFLALIQSQIDQIDDTLSSGKENVRLIADILLTLLEDEERDIRLVSQTVVIILDTNHSTVKPKNETSKAHNQTVAIGCCLRWLSKHFESNQSLSNSLFARLTSNCDLSPYITLFDRQDFFDDRSEFVLFEREEKNVFAEPYIMNIRIAYFLDSLSNQYFKCLFMNENSIYKNIRNSCQQYNQIMTIHKNNKLDSLMFLSIWKLPDFFCKLMNLYLLLWLSSRHNIFSEENSFECTYNQIKSTFPFVLKLQSYLQSDYEFLHSGL